MKMTCQICSREVPIVGHGALTRVRRHGSLPGSPWNTTCLGSLQPPLENDMEALRRYAANLDRAAAEQALAAEGCTWIGDEYGVANALYLCSVFREGASREFDRIRRLEAR